MSFRWPNKDPDETLDYSMDWSRFLGDSITITAVLWSVDASDGTKTSIAGGATVNGIQNVSQSHTNTVATINLGLGTNNTEYKFYCRITDSSGSQGERVVKLRIKER
tara:strand:- start:3194 stop:3514 length:321 start_codon:yes stop_codon:yes gene_type:complete